MSRESEELDLPRLLNDEENKHAIERPFRERPSEPVSQTEGRSPLTDDQRFSLDQGVRTPAESAEPIVEMRISPELGRAIRQFRMANAISQADLANRVGASASMISRLENGQAEPTLGMLQRLADALKIPVPTLLSMGDTNRPPMPLGPTAPTTNTSSSSEQPSRSSKPEPIQVGSRSEWDREASDAQIGLRVDDYAAVLREVYTQAGQGEFSLAIFGHWGRGKTFLMKRLQKHFKASKDNYEVVFFSAWKYPTTPEVWVHLYETMADRAFEPTPLISIPRKLRTGMAQHGPWPVLGALASLAFALTPKLYLANIGLESVAKYVGLVGVGGLIWVALLLWGVARLRVRLSRDFLTATRHTEKLGLQATIGRDLKALLKGWMPSASDRNWLARLAFLCIAVWTSWSAWKWFGVSWGQAPEAWSTASLAAILVFVLMVGIGRSVISSSNSPARILLVVDDLDRCATPQHLHVVESIKLLTEESDMCQRLQVAALVDEDVFGHAVLTKHAEKGTHYPQRFSPERIVRESSEKIFTAHLRLPNLDETDLLEVFDLVVSADRRTQRQKDEEALSDLQNRLAFAKREAARTHRLFSPGTLRARPHVPDGGVADASEFEIPFAERQQHQAEVDRIQADVDAIETRLKTVFPPTQEEKPKENLPEENLVRVDFKFSPSEEEALRRGIQTIIVASEKGPWGPRSVRNFVFKYQLARLLALRLYPKQWNPSVMVEIMTELELPVDQRLRSREYPQLAKIVSQVA